MEAVSSETGVERPVTGPLTGQLAGVGPDETLNLEGDSAELGVSAGSVGSGACVDRNSSVQVQAGCVSAWDASSTSSASSTGDGTQTGKSTSVLSVCCALVLSEKKPSGDWSTQPPTAVMCRAAVCMSLAGRGTTGKRR